MMVIRSSCCLAVLIIAASWATGAVAATDPTSSDDAFTRGAEAYFAGNEAAAEPLFAAAIDHDPHDPRPYYFRALCQRHQGHSVAAQSDCRVALALEARAHGQYPVADWLNRVQRADRLVLEQYRWQVRTADMAADDSNRGFDANRPAIFDIQTDVSALRQPVSVPLDRLVQPVSLSELVADAPGAAAHIATAGNPFADDPRPITDGKLSSGKLIGILGRAVMHSSPVPSFEGLRQKLTTLSPPGTAEKSPPASANFGAGAAATPAEEQPFSAPPTKAAEPKADQPPAQESEEDPFG